MTNTSAPIDAVSELAAKYAARLDALEIQKQTFETIVSTGYVLVAVFSTLFVVGVGVVTWRYGKSWKEIQEAIEARVDALFFRVITNAQADAQGGVQPMKELQDKYQQALSELNEVLAKLKGYSDFSETLAIVHGFDPLEHYLALASEIDHREEATKAQLKASGSESLTDISSTVRDPAFRQRAAAIFARLLEDVKMGQQVEPGETEVKPRVDVITLFNASANAAKVDMDFVALELMDVAVQQDKSNAPDHRARLIRQRLTMSRISGEQAFEALAAVLPDTTAFNLHLVVSEAFNIGVHANRPQEMVALVNTHVPKALLNISYTLLSNARLLAQVAASGDAELQRLTTNGLARLNEEAPSARWYKHSIQEAKRLGLDVSEALQKYLKYRSN